MTAEDQPADGGARDDTIAHLRNEIAAIEAQGANVVRRQHPREAVPLNVTDENAAPARGGGPAVVYPGMPEGDDWMRNLPARYHDGERGFDRRIMEELAAVGVRCYTLGDLANGARTVPQGIPVFVDWLVHLEERIPGAETKHRKAIRAGLIRNLNDPAARGNQQAIDLLLAQLRREPPLEAPLPEYALHALGTIATKENFAAIAQLLDQLPEGSAVGALIEYMGRVKTPEAQAIALRYLDTEWTLFALKALVQMRAAGVRQRVEPYVTDANASVRRYARRALERLPE